MQQQSNEKNWILNAIQYEDGSKKIFRIRSTEPTQVTEQDLSTCIIIDWPYSGQLPEKETMDQIRVFENAIAQLDTEAGDSVLFHIITGSGNREWCYYTKSYAYFINELTTLLHDFPIFPISIEYQENIDWKYWKTLLDFASEESVAA